MVLTYSVPNRSAECLLKSELDKTCILLVLIVIIYLPLASVPLQNGSLKFTRTLFQKWDNAIYKHRVHPASVDRIFPFLE